MCDCHWADSQEIYSCSTAFVQKSSLNFMKMWPVLVSVTNRIIWTDMFSNSPPLCEEHLIKISVYYCVHYLQAIKRRNQMSADNEQYKSTVSIQPFINLRDNLFNDIYVLMHLVRYETKYLLFAKPEVKL